MANSKLQTLSSVDDLTALASLADPKQNKLVAGSGIALEENGETGASKLTTISVTLDTAIFKIVEELPDPSAEDFNSNLIYVIPSETTGEDNECTEYLYNTSTGKWEKLGEFKADTDLSNYYTKEEADAAVEEYTYDKSTIDSKITASGTFDPSQYYTKTEVDSNISDAVSTKQDTLTAGDYINITDNVISVTDVYSQEEIDEKISQVVAGEEADLANYYTKSQIDATVTSIETEIATKQDVLTAGTGIDITDNIISCTLDNTVFKIVDALPTSDIDENVIYVVPNSDSTDENNTFTEYIYVNGAWEKLGEFQAEVDLSDYYTKEQVDEIAATKVDTTTLGDYYTKSEVDSEYNDLEARVKANEDSIELITTILTTIIGE